MEKCDVKTSRSATLPRRLRHVADASSYPVSRDNSPISRKMNTYTSCTLPRNKQNLRRNRVTKPEEVQIEPVKNSAQTSQNEETTIKPNTISLDNSGPSSIESHKSSSKTESSFNSGPSSLESHKTVIDAKKSGISHSNSFTLQVTTNQGVSKLNNKPNATTTTTINGEGGSSTKIFVQNSPVRSVITFENGKREDQNPNLVIINDTNNETFEAPKHTKNTNQSKGTNMNNSRDILPGETNTYNDQKNMNNRKLSLQLPNKDALSFHNLIKNVSTIPNNQFSSSSNPDSPIAQTHEPTKRTETFNSTPPSPTKTDADSSSIGNIYIKNEMGSLEKFDPARKMEKNILGSEPNICSKDNRDPQFPSLNDLTFNFTSLAAQKILKGVGINSVDTLLELNMTSSVDLKQNNCDVVHTDFGLF